MYRKSTVPPANTGLRKTYRPETGLLLRTDAGSRFHHAPRVKGRDGGRKKAQQNPQLELLLEAEERE